MVTEILKHFFNFKIYKNLKNFKISISKTFQESQYFLNVEKFHKFKN